MTQWGLDTLFNPAKRHMDEEKRRLQSTRSEVGDNSGGKRIDLESGKVVIAHPDAPAEADGAVAKSGAEKLDAVESGAAKSGAALSPAAARAAKRRARKTP